LETFLATFRSATAYVCEVDEADVPDDATLDSLGIDSLVASQIIVETEIRAEVELDVEVLESLDAGMTLREVARLLEPAPRPVAL
jgi:acyl carrier protein